MTVAELDARMDLRELVQWGEWLDMKAKANSASGSQEPVSQRQQLQQRLGGG